MERGKALKPEVYKGVVGVVSGFATIVSAVNITEKPASWKRHTPCFTITLACNNRTQYGTRRRTLAELGQGLGHRDPGLCFRLPSAVAA